MVYTYMNYPAVSEPVGWYPTLNPSVSAPVEGSTHPLQTLGSTNPKRTIYI